LIDKIIAFSATNTTTSNCNDVGDDDDDDDGNTRRENYRFSNKLV
jgi:hypothetical protein